MGKQYNKVEKRKRRQAYLKRKKTGGKSAAPAAATPAAPAPSAAPTQPPAPAAPVA